MLFRRKRAQSLCCIMMGRVRSCKLCLRCARIEKTLRAFVVIFCASAHHLR